MTDCICGLRKKIESEIKLLEEMGEEGSINTGRSCSFAIHVLKELLKK